MREFRAAARKALGGGGADKDGPKSGSDSDGSRKSAKFVTLEGFIETRFGNKNGSDALPAGAEFAALPPAAAQLRDAAAHRQRAWRERHGELRSAQIAFERGAQRCRAVALQREAGVRAVSCLLYTSPSPRDKRQSRMPSSA